MGCDIHLIVEQRGEDGAWHRVPHYDRPCDSCDGKGKYESGNQCYSCDGKGHAVQRHYDNRNYDVFAILANVRNGYGFAGVDTGDGFRPLTEGRGIPDDLCAEQRRPDEPWPEGYDWHDKSGDWAYDLGEHSFTWLTYDELLDESYWSQTTKKRGWVGVEGFQVFERDGRPDSWSGGISGAGVEHISNQEMRRRIADGSALREKILTLRAPSYYTLVEWEISYREVASFFLERMADVYLRIGAPNPEDIRITMGFDS